MDDDYKMVRIDPNVLDGGFAGETSTSRDARTVREFTADLSSVEDIEHSIDAKRYARRQLEFIDEDQRRAEAKHQAELDRLLANARAEGKTAEQVNKIVAAHNAWRACVGEVPEDFIEPTESYSAPKAATGFTRIAKGRRAQLVACACPDCANTVRRTSNRQEYCSDACRQRAKKFRTV